MKKILMIAYFYPPKGGPGVQRTAKFAKYLNGMGYDIHVLTVTEDNRSLNDVSLNEDIVEGITVHRMPFNEIQLVKKLNKMINKDSGKVNESGATNAAVQKPSLTTELKSSIKSIGKKAFFGVYNFCYVPDDKASWINDATEEALKIIEKEKIDLLYTTSAPYSAHVIGYNVVKKRNIKWIADFRDQWVNNPFLDYNALTNMRHKALEKKVMETADKVISVSKPIIEDFKKRYPKVDKEKFEIITNGYDENDFIGLNTNHEEKRFKIVYNGTLYGRMSPENVLIAIENLISVGKVDQKKINIEFCGNIGSAHGGKVEAFKAKYPEVVTTKNYLPHKESLENLVNASAALLIIDEGKGSEGIYTGKIFEYIRSGRPIIGIVAKGVARDLIISTNTGECVYPGDMEGLENIIYKLYIDYINGKQSMNQKWDEIEKYERRNLSIKLSNIIKNL